VRVARHSDLERRGDDLWYRLPISIVQAALGTQIEVDLLYFKHFDQIFNAASLGTFTNPVNRQAVDTRAVVGLLSRSIQVYSRGKTAGEEFPETLKCMSDKNANPDCYFGGHVIARQGFKQVALQGVEFKQLGHVNDADVLAYHGSNPNIDGFDHLNGELDNASHRGAYGYEYFGDVPARRWFITKLDLLVAKAIGYTVRQTSAFVPLAITTPHVHFGTISQPYTSTVAGAGGIPFYNWTLASGSLPPGLSLNAFTGAISGTPTAIGTYNFNVRLQEYIEGSTGVTMPFSIIINGPFTDASIVANSTIVRAVHVAELRSRVDALRARDGLAPVVWTDPTLTPGVTTVRALHIAELRTALTQVYAQEMMTAPVFDPGLGQGLNVKAVHITELRAAVLAIE
jgi:hypothetical protein